MWLHIAQCAKTLLLVSNCILSIINKQMQPTEERESHLVGRLSVD